MRHKNKNKNKIGSVGPKIRTLKFPVDYSLYREGISQSLLSKWQQCPVAFLLSLNRWVDPNKGKRTGFGSLFHEMLDKLYHYYSRKGKVPELSLIRDWIEEYADEEMLKGGRGSLSGKAEEEIQRDKTVARILLNEYVTFYPKDFKTKKFDEIEETFKVRFNKYKLRGKIDARYWIGSGRNKERWLMEHKTKSRFNWEELLLKLNFDLQNLFYILADEIENGYDVDGVLYNVVRNPSDKWTKKFTSLREYGMFLKAKVRKNPEHYFLRREIAYSREDKEEFREDLLNKLNQIKKLLNGEIPVYKNESSCQGQYTCDYLRACSAKCLIGYEQKSVLFNELEDDKILKRAAA